MASTATTLPLPNPWTDQANPMSNSASPIPLLTEDQATRALMHAAELVRSAFCILYEATYTETIRHVEEAENDVLRMHRKDLPHSLLTFDNCRLPAVLSARDKLSILCYLMCGDACAYMHGMVKLLLGCKLSRSSYNFSAC